MVVMAVVAEVIVGRDMRTTLKTRLAKRQAHLRKVRIAADIAVSIIDARHRGGGMAVVEKLCLSRREAVARKR